MRDRAEASITPGAFQAFEGGLMLWRAEGRAIYLLRAEGTWSHFLDAWDESQPAYDPTLTEPDGLLQPVRGFGKVWRERLGGPQAAIGWALTPEQGYQIWAQLFARRNGGSIFSGPAGEAYVLSNDGTWVSQRGP
jgi:hypothetical protein